MIGRAFHAIRAVTSLAARSPAAGASFVHPVHAPLPQSAFKRGAELEGKGFPYSLRGRETGKHSGATPNTGGHPESAGIR
jgi:non-ribosomal peptide synthetase component F